MRGGAGRQQGRGRNANTQNQQGGVGRGRRVMKLGSAGEGDDGSSMSQSSSGSELRPIGRGRGISQSTSSSLDTTSSSSSTGAIPKVVKRGDNSSVDDSKSSSDRDFTREQRKLSSMVRSRPDDCVTKSGTSGRKIMVHTNYFRVLKKPSWCIHQYHVDFEPEVELMKWRRKYIASFKEQFGGYVFDGKLLFCSKMLVDRKTRAPLELLLETTESPIMIKVKHVGVVDVWQMSQIQVLNLILRRAMSGMNLQQVCRNFFDPQAKICMDSFRMELWPGYETSIRQHERDILLCVEIAHKVMRTETVYNILEQCVRESKDYQYSFKSEIVGAIVLTDYNNKTYRVDDVDFSQSPSKVFKYKDGTTTFIDYYKTRYGLVIRDKNQPLLVSRPTEKNIRGGQDDPTLLVPEFCRMTGLTDRMRSNFQLMKAMSDETRMNPERRIDRLRKFNKRLKSSEQSLSSLNSWSLEIDTKLVEVPARILDAERIYLGNGKTYTCDKHADWTREFHTAPMFSCVNITRWYVIVHHRNLRDVQNFVHLCQQAANNMKMHIAMPKIMEMPDDRNASYCTAIDNAVVNDPQILMLVLSNNNSDKYECIKKKCCADRAVPSQVVTLRTVAPRGNKAGGLLSIATKVVIQMNAKLKGMPWNINIPLSGLMTVGFDVCHSPSKKNRSYGALVATMDMTKSPSFFSMVSEHMKGQELSNEVSVTMTMALREYQAEHGTLPSRILFYRDGVGEGQLHQVFHTEVKFLKEQLDKIYKSAGASECRLAFIVVSKRINTRLFNDGRNPEPGTVVDDVITQPERYDFFLVSQCVRQGTVAPTNYNVISDNMGFDADRIQKLTYKMTHMYFNWSGTCRVPAVCQYAHKLAFLVAESIHRAPSNALQKQLYFL